MNYTILIYETPADFAIRTDPDPKKREAYWAAWPPYSKALKDAGVFVSGGGLQPPETATTLKIPGRPAPRSGRTVCGYQGAARRLLHPQCAGSRHSARLGGSLPAHAR